MAITVKELQELSRQQLHPGDSLHVTEKIILRDGTGKTEMLRVEDLTVEDVLTAEEFREKFPIGKRL